MAVLTFPGSDLVLAAQAAALPQPDQLCGPFAAYVALHAPLDPAEVPSLVSLAARSGSSIWPHDMAAWRPAGAPLDRTGWDHLSEASSPDASGTDAAGLADGIVSATDETVVVVPAAGGGADPAALVTLLRSVAGSDTPVGVVANVRTGVLGPDTEWDVGHFVVLWAIDDDGGRVAVADTYRELGATGEPPGCRWVPVERLTAALAAPPGRGLLLLSRTADAATVEAMVEAAGFDPTIWST